MNAMSALAHGGGPETAYILRDVSRITPVLMDLERPIVDQLKNWESQLRTLMGG